jgi:uncharacterized RDD family membrane protein YckC
VISLDEQTNQTGQPSNPATDVPAYKAAGMDQPTTVGQTADPLAGQPVVNDAAGSSYAGFWIRFGASFIDSIILSVVTGIINTIFFGGFNLLPASDPDSAATAGVAAGLFGASFLIQIAIQLGYYIILTGMYGATAGKMVFGLRVVDAQGQKIGLGKAAIRETVGKFVSGIVFGLGYLWVAFDEKKQGWHDKIAGTYVVKVR